MKKSIVSIVRYEKPLESVRKAIDLCGGFSNLSRGAKVFIKPNVVFWTRSTPFPKWGLITTSRVVEDVVMLLKELGISDITIGEGPVLMDPKDTETIPHAFESLGYNNLKNRYGLKVINMFERPFKKIDLGDEIKLAFNRDIIESDYVVTLPVLKTHAQTVVSLGIKNLKGSINIASRKKCHNADPQKDLNFMIAKLPEKMPPVFALIDGIYTNERGPSYDGRIHRSNLLIASNDILSADLVGSSILGHEPSAVPHLVHAARNRKRPLDLSDINITGESVESVRVHHDHEFQYNKDNTLPLPMEKMGIRGLSYKKYDLTMCTYCSGINGTLISAIARAWKGKPWDDVEILTGKDMKPTPGMKKTLLLGKCIYLANKDNPDIKEMIPIKSCPPKPEEIVEAMNRAGIKIDPSVFENSPGYFMSRYKDRPEFEESFFKIK
ncbi:DUF362 domain-containing protein [Deltaproteobacteria bacterium]|nr:DUF362 domain-containing protein [Deltaproteobacteria bacterium]